MYKVSLGLCGARGYVGQELVQILARHPRFQLRFVASRTHAGSPVAEHLAGAPADLVFEDLDAQAVAARAVDAVVLALPNGHAEPYVDAIDAVRRDTVILDVSADHRGDNRGDSEWIYGLPEINRARLHGARRIANPGCYATAAALAVKPLTGGVIDGRPHAFGVSGYSGAGATPSPRNDVEALRDNLMPYALVGHDHEREVSRHARLTWLIPHVASWFRGITMTVSLNFVAVVHPRELKRIYQDAYGAEPLIHITDDIPLVRDAVGHPHATIGGFATSVVSRHGVVVVTLDNLLKGAASQAVQNLNLAFGFPELTGIEPWPT